MIATTWNERAQNITGYSPFDALNKLKVFDILTYKDKRKVVESFSKSDYAQEDIFTFLQGQDVRHGSS